MRLRRVRTGDRLGTDMLDGDRHWVPAPESNPLGNTPSLRLDEVGEIHHTITA